MAKVHKLRSQFLTFSTKGQTTKNYSLMSKFQMKIFSHYPFHGEPVVHGLPRGPKIKYNLVYGFVVSCINTFSHKFSDKQPPKRRLLSTCQTECIMEEAGLTFLFLNRFSSIRPPIFVYCKGVCSYEAQFLEFGQVSGQN